MADASTSKQSDYDPHEHRDVANPSSNFEAFIHLFKSSLGIGVIAMPRAFKAAGYVNGTIFAVVFGLIVVHAMHMLLVSMYTLCQRKRVPYMSYPDAMELALASGPLRLRWLSKIASCFVNTMLALYHFGICCVYVVFIAESIKQVSFNYIKQDIDLRFFMLAAALPLLIIFSITSLKSLTAFSVLANLLQIFAFSVLFYFIIVFDDSKTKRNAYGEFTEFPLFYGIVLFAIEALGVILTIEENMKTPKSYLGVCGILNVAMILVLIFNIAMGFMGYWKYGEDVRGSITLNMPLNNILADVTKGVFGVSIAISYALQGYVSVDVIWTRYIKSHVAEFNYQRYEFTLRLFISLLTIFCAMLIPRFSHYLSLVGAFYLSILGLMLPALMDLCVKYPDEYGKYNIFMVRDISILVFGFLGAVLGSGTSVIFIFWAEDDDELPTFAS